MFDNINEYIRGRVVLLVDDDSRFLLLEQELLEYMGLRALVAASAEQALDIFRQRHEEIDLVIMDLNLPHVDGLQLFHELKKIAPAAKIIISSGFFGQEEMDRFSQAGVAGMIHKPFRAHQLQGEIFKALGE